MTNTVDITFDLQKYAQEVKSEIPSHDDLMKEQGVRFMEFLTGLRERVRALKEADRKIFIVLGTGGTFQSARTDSGLAPTGSLRESFDALGLPEDPSVHLELCDLMNLDSSQMTVDQWRFLAKMIILVEETASDLYDGIIVTHGTDTMAKGAAYLSLMLKGFPKSIIFTGSQEPARKSDSDAKDQMERSIVTAKLASSLNRRIAEVMVSCGLKITRGTWAAKLGDKTVDAFGPWNQPNQGFDATDWDRAARDGRLHKLAPALLDFGTGKGRGSMEFAAHAITFENKGPFEPFTEITNPADIFPATLTDKSGIAFARHLIHQRVSILTQLGSATADNRLVNIALKAGEQGKIVIFEAPFHDSTVEVGTYAAGAEALRILPNLQRSLPIVNTSPATFEAKSNYLIHRLGLQPSGDTTGLGVCYTSNELRSFYDRMEQNLVRELV